MNPRRAVAEVEGGVTVFSCSVTSTSQNNYELMPFPPDNKCSRDNWMTKIFRTISLSQDKRVGTLTVLRYYLSNRATVHVISCNARAPKQTGFAAVRLL